MSTTPPKTDIPTKLLWIDLEMTGLDPVQDVILEVSAQITDFDFLKLASYESLVGQPKELVIELMQKNTWWNDYPANRDNFINKLDQAKSSDQVEHELIELVNGQFGEQPAILAGNSIHNDRLFIRQWWPELDAKLHYRMLDVSSFKVLMQGKYNVLYEKQEVHRANDDILASIAELQFYLEWFKNSLNSLN